MKKILSFVLLSVMALSSLSAQSQWTFTTRCWTTNYWTTLIYDAARSTTIFLVAGDNEDDDNLLSILIPSADLVFPIGMEKSGFADPNDIRTPYYYAFGTPIKHMGDFAIGVDASWSPSLIGLYAGAYFKSQEIVFKPNDDHLRGLYFQPRAGILLGREHATIEAGVFYDKTVGCLSTIEGAGKDWLTDGLGLDFAISYSLSDHYQTILQFSMPLHNFLNENITDPHIYGCHRRVGYIMLTQRMAF